MIEDKKKKIILTGDRPTGKLHIGHYFGSLQNRAALQEEYEQYVIIADIQALTDNYDNPEKVRDNVYEVVMDNLAVGVDPKKSCIFIQSMIPEIAELTVLYSNLVTVARLERNPTVKTEMKQKKALFGNEGSSVTYGFLGYPVSQAADITAFDADLVPVGEDQLPVVEQTKEIVRKFNSMYGDILKDPDTLIGSIARVKGLDGNNKMGKSLGNAIYLSDDEETITKKVMSAVTDKTKIKKDDPANPEICMVGYYHKMFSKDECDEVFEECRNGKRGCVDCKKQLSKNITNFLAPIREKRMYYEQRPELVKQIVYEGTNRARAKARETMKKVKEEVKINYFEE
jgi:tryptophanyl-tRNA synthetase